jgi:hypothetical protein
MQSTVTQPLTPKHNEHTGTGPLGTGCSISYVAKLPLNPRITALP